MSDLSGQDLGRYHIIEPLGRGGMATVYKAFDTRLERLVAVKVIRREAISDDMSDIMLRRFEREAKSLAQMSHLHIVNIFDYGEHQGSPYLVMEYMPGGTLSEQTGKPCAFQEAARLLSPVARALEYAHQRNVIHRDVKPANILLTEDGQPKLSDFGVAKILEMKDTTQLTRAGVGVGKPEYMAPEQWTGTPIPQTDVYALGVVFYELVTGRKPYEADTPAAVLLKQTIEPLPRPRDFAPHLPELVENILYKALAKQPEDRYPGMGQFASALEALSSPGTGAEEQDATRLRSRRQVAQPITSAPPPAPPGRATVPRPVPSHEPAQSRPARGQPGPPVKKKPNLPLIIGGASLGGLAIITVIAALVLPGLIKRLAPKTASTDTAPAQAAASPSSPSADQTAPTPPTDVAPEETTAEEQSALSSPTPEPSDKQAIEALWHNSSHAAADDYAFNRWNEYDPAEIPTNCAKCHSTSGYLDYLGADDSLANAVDNPVPVGEVIECVACHSEAAQNSRMVLFPSGVTLNVESQNTACITCHQGRQSKWHVEDHITSFGGSNDRPDTVIDGMIFVNIHYDAAAVSLFGSDVSGGYEYDGKTYQGENLHVEIANSCTECHDPHDLKIDIELCVPCHPNMSVIENARAVDMAPDADYDGDGNSSEGIYFEILGLQETLNTAIQEYARQIGRDIVYDIDVYPYYFYDTNGNGKPDGDEASSENRYLSFTPRLLQAAYNYNASLTDPGAYVHGGRYIAQLLYDSIEDLGALQPNLTRP